MLLRTLAMGSIGLLGVAALWVSQAAAQVPDVPGNYLEGMIVAVDDDDRTITVELEEPAEGGEVRTETFKVPPEAEIVVNGVNVDHARTMEDLRIGQEVVLEYKEDSDGGRSLVNMEG